MYYNAYQQLALVLYKNNNNNFNSRDNIKNNLLNKVQFYYLIIILCKVK